MLKTLFTIFAVICVCSGLVALKTKKPVDIWNDFRASLAAADNPQSLSGAVKIKAQKTIIYTPTAVFSEWIEQNKDNTAWHSSLPACPAKVEIKYTNNKIPQVIHPDPAIWLPLGRAGKLHGSAIYQTRSFPLDNKAGSQCTYDAQGNLYKNAVPEEGTADFISPSVSRYLHYIYDVEPFFFSVLLSAQKDYHQVRPSK